jgi:Rieske Fe-S protein
LAKDDKDPLSEILIVGGEDHKTGQNLHPEECYGRLERWARERFPLASAVVSRWSGQVMEPVDGMAFLGHNPLDRKSVYVITGDSGNGMTHCTIGALLIRDQIFGIKNSWEQLYNPSRVSMFAIGEFAKENSNVVAQYGDWFTGGQITDVDQIPVGEGRVMRQGLEKIAIYKDPDGNLEMYSAVCPHLGGIVRWNSAEKSWDCPCHGSRFNCHGRVIEGPAFVDLKESHHWDPEKFDEISILSRAANTFGFFGENEPVP